jgi:hypothetical protein
MDRKTVRRYLAVARAAHLDESSLDDFDAVGAVIKVVQKPSHRISEKQHQLASMSNVIRGLLAERMTLARIHQVLGKNGVAVSYATLRRFAIRELGWKRRPDLFDRAA